MKDILIPNNYISLEKELLILIVKYLNEIRIDNKDFEELDVLGKQVTVPDDYILQIFKSFRRYLELDVGPNLKPIKSILRAPSTIFHTVHNDGSTSTAAERRFSNSSFFIKSLHNRPISIPHYMSKQSFNQVKTLCGREIKGSWNFESFKMEGNVEILPVKCYETNFDRYTCILGHLSSVYCVAFDRTGHYIITGADDHLIKIWGAWDGRLLKTLRGHSAEITDLAIDAENLLLAASSVNKIIRVWSLTRNFCPVAILTGHSAMITTLQFSPFCLTDKRYLVSSGNDGNICVWVFHVTENKFDQTPVKFIERSRPSNQMLCTSFSPGGLFLAAGGSDHVTRIYFFGGNDRPEKMDELEIHTDRVDSIKFANHSLRFITGSRDGLACIWSFDSYTRKWTSLTVNMSTKLHNINGSGNTNTTNYNSNTKEQEKSNAKLRVTMVAWNSDDTVVITAMTNFRMKVWDSMNGQLLHELKGHTDDIFVLEYHPRNPRFMVSASHDGFLILWDLKFGISVTKIFNNIENQGHGAIFDAKFAPHGLLLASTDSHGQLSIYGYGRNNAYEQCPREQFFHTDFRPLIRNLETYEVTDEQTHIAPHLMPPPFLVDIDGNPYPPHVQRRVPGRHDCLDEQLIPNVAPRENGELEIMDFIENRENPSDNTPPNELNNVILPTSEQQQQQPTGEEEGIRITSINNIPRHLSTLTNNVGNENISLPQNTEEEKDNVNNTAVHSNIIRGNRTYHNVDQPIIDFYVKLKREAASYELELYKGLYNVLPVNHHERLRSARLHYYYGGAPTRKGTTIFNTSSSFCTNHVNDKKSFCNNVANNKTHISLLHHRRRGRQPKNASAAATNNGMEESQTIINSGNGGHLNFIEESDVNEISGYRFADESSLENKLNNDDALIRSRNLAINNNDTTCNNRKNQLPISSNASNLLSRTRQTQPQNFSTTFNNTTLPLLQNNNVSDAEESSAESTIYSDWEMEHGGGLGTAAAIYSSTSSIHNVNGTHSSTTKTTGSSASASSFSCHLRNKNRNRRNYAVESQSVGNTNAKRKGGGFRRQPFLGPATTSASAITAGTPAKYYRRNNKRRRLLIPNTVSTAVRTSSKRKLNGNGSNSPQTSDFNPWRPSSSSTTTTTTTISSTSMLPLYNKRRRHVGRPSKLLHGGSNKCHRPVSNQFKTKVFPINRSVQNYDGRAARPFTRGMASINAAAASVKQEVLQTDDEETEIHSTKIKLKKRDGALVDKEESLIVLSTNKQKGYFYRRHDNLSEDEDKSLDVETTGEVNRGKESIVDEDKDILDGSHSEHVKSEERAPRLRRLYGPMAPPPIKTSSTSSSAASSSYYELRRRKLKIGYGNHHHHLHRLNRQRYPKRPNHLRYRRNRIVESSSKRPLTTNLLTGTRRATKRNLNGGDSNYSHYSNISHSYNTRRQIAKTEHNGEEEYVDGGGGVNKKEEQPLAFKEKADDSSSLFVVPDWMTECDPKKTPFFPQIGDEIVYFREGHELYVDMVRTSGTYPLEMKTLPYVRQPSLRAVEFARVTGLRFEIRPPRLCCVKLALTDPSGCLTGGTFSFKYHDVPHVVDFCILKQTYEENLKRAPRSFHEGSRIKAYIDDIWWKGTIVSNNYLYYLSSVDGDDVNVTHNNNNASTSAYEDTVSDPLPPTSSNTESSTLYYDIFLKYVVIWDKTGDLDKLSPWDMELIDEGEEEEEEEDDTGDAEDVSQQKEIPTTSKNGQEKTSAEHTNGNALLYIPKPEEWSLQGRDQDIERISNGLSTVMSLADAEPFIAPVDFKEYYDYLHTIPYPIDLSLIKQRLQNGYYRRRNSLLYDLRLLLTNAKLYNDQKSQIVHQATLILELCSDVVFNERSRPLALYKTLISHNYKDKFNHSISLSDEADQQQHAVSATTATNHQFATRTHLNVIPESTSQNLPNQINFSATSSKPNNSSTAANYELRDVIAKLRHGPGATHQHHHQHTINNAGGTGGELTISNNWLEMCKKILDELLCHEDSEPFRSPVDTNAYPNYRIVIKEPIDLGTIQKNLFRGFYRSYKQFRQDIRLMFANSKAFNTNKRSIIYSMTLRLSALFEARIKAFLNAMSSSGTRGGPVSVTDNTIEVSPYFNGSASLNNNRSFDPNYRRVDNSTISQNAEPLRLPGIVENDIQIPSQQQQLDESSLSLQQSATTTAEVGVRAFNETYRGRFKNLRFRAAENRRRNERRLRLDEEDVDNEITNLNNIPISNDNHSINQEQSEESTNYIGRPKRKTVIARNPCKRTLERAVKFSSSSTEISSSDNAIRTTRSIEHLSGHGSSNKIIINKNLIYPTTSNSNSNESAEEDLIEQETSLLTSTSKKNNENLNEDTTMQSSCQLNDSSSEEKSLKIIVEDLNLKGPNDLSTGQRFTRSQNKPSNNINYNYNHYYYDEDDDDDEDPRNCINAKNGGGGITKSYQPQEQLLLQQQQQQQTSTKHQQNHHIYQTRSASGNLPNKRGAVEATSTDNYYYYLQEQQQQYIDENDECTESGEPPNKDSSKAFSSSSDSKKFAARSSNESEETDESSLLIKTAGSKTMPFKKTRHNDNNNDDNNNETDNNNNSQLGCRRSLRRNPKIKYDSDYEYELC